MLIGALLVYATIMLFMGSWYENSHGLAQILPVFTLICLFNYYAALLMFNLFPALSALALCLVVLTAFSVGYFFLRLTWKL